MADREQVKRLRRPKLKDGELKMYWGKERSGDAPDVMYSWQGDRTMRYDAHLLHNIICTKRPDTSKTPIFSVMLPSLIEELDSRGYDITTLKFSIMKKPNGE